MTGLRLTSFARDDADHGLLNVRPTQRHPTAGELDHRLDERRALIEDMIQAVTIYADRLEVTVTGAPPLLVILELAAPRYGPVVSEG